MCVWSLDQKFKENHTYSGAIKELPFDSVARI